MKYKFRNEALLAILSSFNSNYQGNVARNTISISIFPFRVWSFFVVGPNLTNFDLPKKKFDTKTKANINYLLK